MAGLVTVSTAPARRELRPKAGLMPNDMLPTWRIIAADETVFAGTFDDEDWDGHERSVQDIEGIMQMIEAELKARLADPQRVRAAPADRSEVENAIYHDNYLTTATSYSSSRTVSSRSGRRSSPPPSDL